MWPSLGHFLEGWTPKIRIKASIRVFITLVFMLDIISLVASENESNVKLPLTAEEIDNLKEEARDMFYHAYRAYMENAYPADELMPLSCKGRWKDPLNNRGDLDDTLGNFSLTLIDTLDTLVLLGDLEEFESAVKLVIRDVSFDQDVVVSVFETNIRVLGGMLSAHILAEYLQQRAGRMLWYNSELLTLAKDLGYRLLPAFYTSTGIPYSRINLRHGMKRLRLAAHMETCTACAGTMVLEMAALSRLTGEPLFEEKAHRAMDELWRMRNRSSNLMGTVLNVHSGDWIRRDSGVGAGIDSYYEYCLKAYILLGDETYLTRFNRHYTAVMKYISQGPLMVDVLMHRPHTNSKNFMDALLAFWPGLQVLKGDLKPAVATHEMLYQVMQRHNLLPEAFTTDFQVHWGQHPLRPEFVESTYFLYKATNDPYYLEVGKVALKSLQKHARVPCGYATIKDVRTGGHDDRMDSFVLAETFKYLYLLFANPNDLLLDLDDFVFTTEAHLLPLTLARSHNGSRLLASSVDDEFEDVSEFARICPNTLDLFPETVRLPLKNMVDGVCPRRMAKRKLYATQFAAGNSEHVRLLKNMGISIVAMGDGQVHLMHSAANARCSADADEGVMFMQEMAEMAQEERTHTIYDRPPLSVSFILPSGLKIKVPAGRAHFGLELTSGMKVSGLLAVAEPLRACEPLVEPERLMNRIVIVQRGDCIFVNKVRKVQKAGALAVIVVDNTRDTSSATSSIFAMSGDGTNDMNIPAVFLFHQEAQTLLNSVPQDNPQVEVTIADESTPAGSTENGDKNTSRQPVAEPKTAGMDQNGENLGLPTVNPTTADFNSATDSEDIIRLEKFDKEPLSPSDKGNDPSDLLHKSVNNADLSKTNDATIEGDVIKKIRQYELDKNFSDEIDIMVQTLLKSVLYNWRSPFQHVKHCDKIISIILNLKNLLSFRPHNWIEVGQQEIKILQELANELKDIFKHINLMNDRTSRYDEKNLRQQLQLTWLLKSVIWGFQKNFKETSNEDMLIVNGNKNYESVLQTKEKDEL